MLHIYLEYLLHLDHPADDHLVPGLALLSPGPRRTSRLLENAGRVAGQPSRHAVVVVGVVVARPEGGVLHAVEVGVVFNTEI